MSIKFKEPPISELVIATYFNPPLLKLRSEHIGLFWSSIKKEFPTITQNPPHGSIDIGSEGEIFPMPRYWVISKDDISLIQLQKNAFMFNWRRREKDYPHYDNLKEAFDRHYGHFADFIRDDVGIENPSIDVCELTYINMIEPCEYWSGISDTNTVIPSFFPLTIGRSDIACPSFNAVFAYALDDTLQLRVTIRDAKSKAEPTKPVLVFEIRATGRLGGVSKSDADKWFDKGHSAIIDCFLGLTNPDIQHTYWIPIEETS